MKSLEKEYIIDQLNEIINSHSSKISKKDIEKLVVIREKVKKTEKKNILKIISHGLFHVFFDD